MVSIIMDFNSFDWEIDKVVEEIIKRKKRYVLIKLPDGLKIFGFELVREIEKKLKEKNWKAYLFLWLNSSYGACDVLDLKNLEDFLVIDFGHSKWKFE